MITRLPFPSLEAVFTIKRRKITHKSDSQLKLLTLEFLYPLFRNKITRAEETIKVLCGLHLKSL
jgi:hypothetical protein